MKITLDVKVPRIPAGLISNLVGLLGLVAIVLAVGGLTHNAWWAALVGGVFCVGLAIAAQQEASPAADASKPAGASDAPTQPIPKLSDRRVV